MIFCAFPFFSFFFLLVVAYSNKTTVLSPRDAAAVLFGLKFADNIHYKFKSSQASKTSLQSSKHTGAKQNVRKMATQGHSR